jgi:uncharacterized protein
MSPPPHTDAPYLGLGLSTNLGATDEPNPWRLLEARPGLFDFVEYSAPLHVADARREAAHFPLLLSRRAEVPAVYHPVHLNLWGEKLESTARLAALDAHVREVGSPWVGNDVGWWHHEETPFPGYLFVPPPMSEAGLADAVRHARHVQSALSVPLLLETPATQARTGPLHVLEFMARLHAETGLGLILDLGHLFSHQLALGLPADAGFEAFPFEAVVEIHIAGGVVTRRGDRRFYVDDHTQPVREELFEMLEAVLPRCTLLKGVTFEGDGHPDGIAARTLERLRAVVPAPRGTPAPQRTTATPGRVAPPVSRPAGPVPPSEEDFVPAAEPWTWFARAYGIAPHEDDPEGMEAEVDYRLAVLADRIDRDFRLTRLFLAPEGAGLRAFAASPEFRGLFAEGEATAASAFAAWARARLEKTPDPAAERLLAFETFAQGLLRNAASATPPDGRLALGRGVALGRFPEDLSEALFAARALERHLGGRAWASGRLEASGLSSLAQAARRPGPGPWAVAVRRASGRVECVGLDPTLGAILEAATRGVEGSAILGSGAKYREAMHRALLKGLVQVG